KEKKDKHSGPKTPVTTDPRFASVHNDPRFLRPKKKDTKVVIDKRFASMMDSTEFSESPLVDKYGRKLEKNTAGKDLQRYYQMESDEEEEDDDKMGYDPMRGRGVIDSSDEESSEEEEEEEEEAEEEADSIQHIPEGEETSRLALVNMDWDKIKAVDILKVLNGFKPDTSVIKRVSIYPSEFGKERLQLEDMQGPPREIFKTKVVNEDDSADEEVTAETVIKNQLEEGDGADFDQEALRKYQLERLKYYYAVIECDSPETARIIYKSCDNTEFESSANFFDLRYIPDDMTFDDEPKDVATIAPDNYKPLSFQTEALQHTKVKLTWDEDDMNRMALTRREFTEDDIKNSDFDAYLASSDEEEDEVEDLDAIREKYRSLLKRSRESAFEDKVEEDEEEGDMEITFTPGLSEKAGFVDKKDKKEKKSKKRTSKEEREEKARERAELELLMDDDGKSEGFNMKEVLKREKMEKKKKGKKTDLPEDDFEINVDDPRFAALKESHHFAIDPTNPQFKKTKNMKKLINARHNKMKKDVVDKDE
ncbi:hypothetical protein BDB01DRAFT_693667, partial [Pilobolus umbonatus]